MPYRPFYVHDPCEATGSGRVLLLGLGAAQWDEGKPRVRYTASIWQDPSAEFPSYRSLDLVGQGSIVFESAMHTRSARGEFLYPSYDDYEPIMVRGDTRAYLRESYVACEEMEDRESWQGCGNHDVRSIFWSTDLPTGGQIIYRSYSDPTIHELEQILAGIDRLVQVD